MDTAFSFKVLIFSKLCPRVPAAAQGYERRHGENPKHRHNIGELGEQYIFEKELNHLISQGKINQNKEVIHVSLKNDSEGYDIVSFTDTGERKYIEVKTTTGNEFEPFYLSNSEMEAMKRLNNYWIYRVYNFNVDLKKGDLYKIDCKKEIDHHYNIQASSFRVTPKR
jgi:hypothetical protein